MDQGRWVGSTVPTPPYFSKFINSVLKTVLHRSGALELSLPAMIKSGRYKMANSLQSYFVLKNVYISVTANHSNLNIIDTYIDSNFTTMKQ
jgi:hypothetical protein